MLDDFPGSGPFACEKSGLGDEDAVRCGGIEDLGRGRQIPLHQDGRDEKRVGVVVETAAAAAVRGEFVRRTVGHAEQVADGVVVFHAVQPMAHHVARILLDLGVVDSGQRRLDPGFKPVLFLGRGLLLVLGRHFAGVDLLVNLLPELRVTVERRLIRELRQIDLALLLFLPVAVMAIRHQQRLDVLAEVRRRSTRIQARPCQDQQSQQPSDRSREGIAA